MMEQPKPIDREKWGADSGAARGSANYPTAVRVAIRIMPMLCFAASAESQSFQSKWLYVMLGIATAYLCERLLHSPNTDYTKSR